MAPSFAFAPNSIRASLPHMNRNFWRVAAVIAIAFPGTLASAQTDDNFFGNKTPDVTVSVSATIDGIKIISAVWGSGDHFADVTDRVIALLSTPDTTLKANPDWLKSDPIPHWNKALVIVYELNGSRYLTDSGEDAPVSIQMLKDHAAAEDKK
jgi:hypothetical protein